jgi:TolB-like protein/DNA-binding winged helix-turn-helix (wHTH) protein
MATPDEPKIFEFGEFRVDAAQRALLAADGVRIALTSRAFELLLYFVRHPGELLDKERLMKAVWPETVVEENNLNQSIGAIRKALGERQNDRRFVVTDPGRGYRFVAPVRVVERTTNAAPPSVEIAEQARRRWPLASLIAAGLLIVVAIAWFARQRAPAIVDRSIAVLPFENRSEARENGYLALGIQDEVLTLLTRIGDLRVIPRGSTAKFAATKRAAPDIGSELGVSYLLEGSVQRSGERIRVNVALIDAAADRQLWASSYERSAREVFAVESEVARDVATVLQAKLTAQERASLVRPPTRIPAAYDAYLRAKAFAERTTRTEAEIHGAIEAYEAAVRLDADFTTAWAQLSRRHANLYSLGYDRSVDRRDAALRALEHAVALDPDLFDVQAARGYFLFVVEGKLEEAGRLYRNLAARSPASPDPSAGLAQIERALGNQSLSNEYAQRVLALDPRNPYRHAIICHDFLTARELDLASATCARALELLPGDTGILTIQATIHQARGELDRARALLHGLTPAPGDWRTLRAMSRQMELDRDPAAAVRILASSLENADALATRRGIVRRWLADAQRLAGQTAAAKSTYAQALAEIEAELALQPANPTFLAELATVRARLGSLEGGSRLEPRCLELAESSGRDAFVADCRLARIQVELAAGDPARAVILLKDELTARGAMPPLTSALLNGDPEYDALRSRKDFRELR